MSHRYDDNFAGDLPSFTNPTLTDSNNFSFAAMGDIHVGAAGGNVFERAAQLSAADGDSFAVTLGDNTNSGLDSEARGFKAQMDNAPFSVFPAIGNHDIFFSGWQSYKWIVGRSMYTIQAGPVRIYVLDSANGTFGEKQLNWLRRELMGDTSTLKVVATHFPIFSGVFSGIFKLSSDEEASVFKAMMSEFGVDLVLAGHYHGHSERTVGGTRYIVSGACNNILDPGERMQYLKIIVTNGDTITTDQKYL